MSQQSISHRQSSREGSLNESRERFLPPPNFSNLFLNGNFIAGEEEQNIAAAVQNNINNDNNNNNESDNEEHVCWVFGYGSLCWRPGFDYTKCITGYIRGYVRRFWQGNTTHRGTPQKPGRVATLIGDKEGITWGCAYRITGDTALEYLKQRECTLGGYTTIDTKFFPRVASIDTPFSGESLEVLVYLANPESEHWLGEDTNLHIAEQICECNGPSGHNVEYLLRLAQFLHDEIPEVVDDHLFELERLVLEELHKRHIPLWSVMGAEPQHIRRDSHENIKHPISFEFTSRVSERKLRCLNI